MVVVAAHQVVGAVAQTTIQLSHTAVRRNTDAQLIVQDSLPGRGLIMQFNRIADDVKQEI